jgi:hypothetical protein
MNHLSVQSLGVAYPAKMQYSVGLPKSRRYAEARHLADVLLAKVSDLSETEREALLVLILRGFHGPIRLGSIHFPVDRKGAGGFTTGGGYTYDHVFSYR